MTKTVSDETRAARRDQVIAEAKRLSPIFALRAADHDRDASFPFENFPLLQEAGLLNLTIPADKGGDGLGIEPVCRVLEELATGDPATTLVLSMQYLQRAAIARSGRWPSEVYDRVCRESVEGLSLINAARVEPELGTPARGGLPATTAKRTAGGWSISGRKIYTTGAPVLAYAIVWAKTDEDPLRVGQFLVPFDSKGVIIERTWNHLGMRATGSDDMVMEDVEIPYEYGVDVHTQDEWKSLGDNAGGAQGGLALSALYNGVAISVRDWLVNYLSERTPTNLGASLATLPRFQTVVGEIESLLYINERLIYDLADATDNATRPLRPGEAGLVKSIVTDNVVKVAQMALELTGNPGLSKQNDLERHYRDALCGRVHTPQTDSVLLAAGRTALSIKASGA